MTFKLGVPRWLIPAVNRKKMEGEVPHSGGYAASESFCTAGWGIYFRNQL